MHDARERHQRLQEVFDQALSHDPAVRNTYLDGVCAGDRELRIAVAQLLSSAGGVVRSQHHRR
jgi:hypothetical protein